jgi:hypothetical protein
MNNFILILIFIIFILIIKKGDLRHNLIFNNNNIYFHLNNIFNYIGCINKLIVILPSKNLI